MNPTTHTRRLLWTLVIVVCVALVILYIAAHILLNKTSSGGSAQGVIPTMQSILAGDKQQAFHQAGNFLTAYSADDAASALAQRIYASSAFSIATTSEQRVAAIELMKQGYLSATNPDARSLMINLIATELILSPGDKNDIYNAVFTTEPFRQFEVPGAYGKSIQKILAYSISIYPTDRAYYLRALLSARDIENTLLAGSPLPSEMDASQKVAQNIVKYIQAGDRLAQQDTVPNTGTGFEVWTKAQNGIFRGLGFSGAALVDSAMLSNAEAAFADVIKTAQSADANNQSLAALNTQAAYAHLYSARILYLRGGDSRLADVRTHLSNFVSTITRDPKNYADVYSMFASINMSASSTNQSAGGGNRQSQLFDSYTDLAKVSPELKSFLISQGWSLK